LKEQLSRCLFAGKIALKNMNKRVLKNGQKKKEWVLKKAALFVAWL
jgi:hypothetical protein